MVKKKSSKLRKNKTSKRTAKKVLPIPKGYHSLTPYLIVNDGINAIEFYKKVFGAKEIMRMELPGGKISHVELQIGNAKMMLSDECLEKQTRSPQSVGGSPVGIHLYIKNVDTIVKRAVAAGAKLLRPVENMFYGDRSGTLIDPYGHTWCVSTHIENITPAQAKKRAAELYSAEK